MTKTKTTNRVLSLVLALLMVLSLFPAMGVSAFAEEGETATTLSDGQYIVPVLPIVWKTEAASTSNLPNSYAEVFALAEHVSAACAYVTNFGNDCPITEAGVTFFTSVSTCSADGVSMMEFNGITPQNATVEQLIGMNLTCYNSFRDFTQLFTSQ